MALINCLECKKEVSSLAKTCPHCGCPVSVSLPEEPFDLKVLGGSIEINRSPSVVARLLLKSAENLNLASHLDGRHVLVEGTWWRHGGTIAEFSLTEDTESSATKLSVEDVSGKIFADGSFRKLIGDILDQVEKMSDPDKSRPTEN